jgi:hypothetical protein
LRAIHKEQDAICANAKILPTALNSESSLGILTHMLLHHFIYEDEVVSISMQLGEGQAMGAERAILKRYLRNLCQLHFIYHALFT